MQLPRAIPTVIDLNPHTLPRLESPVASGGYWSLNQRQQAIFAAVMDGRQFVEAGCGDGSLAVHALKSGAIAGFAFDKESTRFPRVPGLKFQVAYGAALARDLKEPMDVLLLSYPRETDAFAADMAPLVKKAETVVYLGDNFEGFCCGGGSFWREVSQRQVLAHASSHRNSLIVYGAGRRQPGLLLWEELGGLDRSKVYPRPDGEIFRGKLDGSSQAI